ncbi:MAG TPA: hypothetical protein VFW93_03585 [Aquabacterium sp.]|uniref:hypothetical protein n=1 Tax=Aquabacterium sp. TaxID=1872578 RepID=UPI002E35F695|nr:hypothetical protein [Aquabacterium sp.]HEX5355273.1 hypothetical protein [Aquabacterium sp.]
MQKYSVSDVADLMKPKPVRVDPSLKEFGMLVAAVMDQDNDMSKFSVNGRQKNA